MDKKKTFRRVISPQKSNFTPVLNLYIKKLKLQVDSDCALCIFKAFHGFRHISISTKKL
jgi:hypothetical protein